jgi:hypothetical protein
MGRYDESFTQSTANSSQLGLDTAKGSFSQRIALERRRGWAAACAHLTGRIQSGAVDVTRPIAAWAAVEGIPVRKSSQKLLGPVDLGNGLIPETLR